MEILEFIVDLKEHENRTAGHMYIDSLMMIIILMGFYYLLSEVTQIGHLTLSSEYIP